MDSFIYWDRFLDVQYPVSVDIRAFAVIVKQMWLQFVLWVPMLEMESAKPRGFNYLVVGIRHSYSVLLSIHISLLTPNT